MRRVWSCIDIRTLAPGFSFLTFATFAIPLVFPTIRMWAAIPLFLYSRIRDTVSRPLPPGLCIWSEVFGSVVVFASLDLL